MGLKMVLNVDRLTCTVEVHKILYQKYLETCRNIPNCIEMAKINLGIAPPAVFNMFNKVNWEGVLTRRQTNNQFVIPCTRLEFGKCNFCYRGAKIWDLLPVCLNSCDGLATFKVANVAFGTGKYPNGIP